MTPKEGLKQLIEGLRCYPNMIPAKDIDKALALLDQIDDRAEKMVKWNWRTRKYARNRADTADFACEVNRAWWNGRYECTRDFLKEFTEDCDVEDNPTITAREWHDYE